MRTAGWKDLLAHLVALATVQRGPVHDGEVAATGVKCALVNVRSVCRRETQAQRPASSEQLRGQYIIPEKALGIAMRGRRRMAPSNNACSVERPHMKLRQRT